MSTTNEITFHPMPAVAAWRLHDALQNLGRLALLGVDHLPPDQAGALGEAVRLGELSRRELHHLLMQCGSITAIVTTAEA